MDELKISAPWITYVHKVQELFKKDPDIQIHFDDINLQLTLRVTGTDKADALSQLLPEEKIFNGMTVHITVVPANLPTDRASLIETAFKGNKAFSRMLRVNPGSSTSFNYAMFEREVVQYWNDNLGDPHGLVSTLYQDIARDVLGDEGVMYCTDNSYCF